MTRSRFAVVFAALVVALAAWTLLADDAPDGGAAAVVDGTPRADVPHEELPPPASTELPRASAEEPAPLAATPPAPAAGRVVAHGVLTTEPRRVTGRLLRLADLGPLADVDVMTEEGSARTDADGRFALRAAPDEVELLVAYAPFSERLVPITPGADDLDLGDVVVDSGWTLAGHVVDASGAPVEGATVRMARMREDVTAADGSFVLRDVPDLDARYANRKASRVRIEVLSPWFVDAWSDVPLPDRERVVRDLRFVLASTGAIVGTVTGPDGAPRAGLSVRPVLHVDVTGPTGGVRDPAETDAQGNYRLDGVAPGVHVLEVGPSLWDEYHGTRERSDAEGPTLARVLAGPAVVSAHGTTRLDVALPAVGAVTGHVTDTAGAPLDDVAIKVWTERAWPVGGPARGSASDLFVDGEGVLHATRIAGRGASDANGRFRVDDVPPGPVRLEAETSRRGASARVVRAVEVPEDGDAVVGLVIGAGPEVLVEVVDEQAGPAADARVLLVPADDEAPDGGAGPRPVPRRRLRAMMTAGSTGLRVDDAGRFTFSGVDEDRPHDLVVAASGRRSVLLSDVRPDPAPRRVVLRPERVLAFRLLDALTSRPLERPFVTWRVRGPLTELSGASPADDDGLLVIGDLPDEGFRVELEIRDREPWIGAGLVPHAPDAPPHEVLVRDPDG